MRDASAPTPRSGRHAGRRTLTAEEILDAGARLVGLPAEPGLAWEGLVRATDGFREYAGTSPLASQVFEGSSIRRVANYLALEELARAAAPTGSPGRDSPEFVFVAGLPRTGSSLLHNLLALEPATAALRHVDVENPLWMLGTMSRAEAIVEVERWSEFNDLLDPRLKTVHPMGPEWPDECSVLLATCFAGYDLSVWFGVPTYLDWIRSADLVQPYEFHRRATDIVIAHTEPTARRVVLKSPFHLPHLETLRRLYPIATWVNIVRRVDNVVASYLMLLQISHDALYGRPLPTALRDRWLDVLAEMARASIDLADEAGCHTIRYDELARDPVGTVTRLLDAQGRTISPIHADALRAWLRQPAARQRAPRSSLPTFGLTHDSLPDDLRRYDEAFGPWPT